MENTTTNISDTDFALNFNNFDAENIQLEETINVVLAVDVSPSIGRYETELNNAINEFIQEMQKSHVAPKLFVSIVTFNEQIEVKSGFQPITNLPPADFRASGQGTALYDAVKVALDNALSYRKTLVDSGVDTKTLVFVITDGEDNSSAHNAAAEVKDKLDQLRAEEVNMINFNSMLFGVGTEAYFEDAQKQMGINELAKIGTSGAEMRKMIGFISSSISSISGGQPVPSF